MATKKARAADVIIVGAGPAGAMAALTLARTGMQVTLVDSAKYPRPKICAGWLGPRGVQLLSELGVSLKPLNPIKLTEALFASADLSKTAKPAGDLELGVAVERAAFDSHLVDLAKKAGAKFIDRSPVTALLPGETHVEAQLQDESKLTGKYLIVATGIARKLLAGLDLRLPAERAATYSAHLTVDQPDKKSKQARMVVSFDATPDAGCAFAIETPISISLTVHARGDERETVRRLIEFARGLHDTELLSVDLTQDAAKAKGIPSYPFNALETDSLVGKRSIVVGDAGGFYASVSHEGIFPAIWSATIAAQTIAEVGPDDHAQDVLTKFDRAWRLEMADFLRPPNTDLQLLLPLIFTNQPMANRMGAAFFGGENI